jgi:hypothetical protein
VRNENQLKQAVAHLTGWKMRNETGPFLHQIWCNVPEVSRLGGDFDLPTHLDTDFETMIR